MCDTIVALGNSTKDGSVLFGKNSDREPNEPHIMIRVPRRKNQVNEGMLKTTFMQIPQAAETYEVLLLKPSWIWGCEMGANEFGLNIGNEAVFTKEKLCKTGLTGMDMVRIALERCQNSDQALNMITDLLETYGQGGNCGYEKSVMYHNSFLIADKNSAWVLETAGKYWAAKKVQDVYSISNGLTIESDFDKCHPELIKNAIEKHWCKNEKDFNFKKCYSKPLTPRLLGVQSRLCSSNSILKQKKGEITVETIKEALRAHSQDAEGKQFQCRSVKSVCMHSGGFEDCQTTGSYIASIKEKLSTYWVTGSSIPCISVFKPIWMMEEAPLFSEGNETEAIEYWNLREKLHRLVLEGKVDLRGYLKERDRLESDFEGISKELNLEMLPMEKLAEITNSAFQREEELVRKVVEAAENNGKTPKLNGGLIFKRYWKKKNIKFRENLRRKKNEHK